MKSCVCRPGCPAAVKGKGIYAPGHAPNSRNHIPGILLKIREKTLNIRRTKKRTEAIN